MAPMQRVRKAEAAEEAGRGGTVLHHARADAPVFAALAEQWRSAGRMVPGHPDPEWSALVSHTPHLTPT
jgi:hypothetical protein